MKKEMNHPCRAARDPLKGAALAAGQSRFRDALVTGHRFGVTGLGYWLTGDFGSSSKAITSLRLFSFRMPLCPARGICEHAL